MKSILVTAFEPFGGDKLNPTTLALSELEDEIGGFAIKKLILPVEFSRAALLAASEYDALSPAAVIMLGQAGGRPAVTPEAVGRNIMDARIPDNAGFQPHGEPIKTDGPDELYSTLPIEKIVIAIRSLGLPAEISRDAGAYVCNSLLYGMLAHNGGRVPTGFIHVPFIREQVEGANGRENLPFMELADVIRAVRAAVQTVTEL